MPARINQTSLYTFTDDPAGTYRYGPAAEPAWDDTYLANHIEVNAADGTRGLTGSGVAVDTASTTDYGVIVKSVESQLLSGGDRQSLAEYLAYLYAQPQLRLPELELLPAINPAAAWPAALSLEISDPITVKRFAGLASEMTLDLTVEGMTFGGNAQTPFQTKVRTSPRDTATYMVADDATLGLTDSGNRAAP